jgi:hypothetical protein
VTHWVYIEATTFSTAHPSALPTALVFDELGHPRLRLVRNSSVAVRVSARALASQLSSYQTIGENRTALR